LFGIGPRIATRTRKVPERPTPAGQLQLSTEPAPQPVNHKNDNGTSVDRAEQLQN
jgi:hypothetical protein